MLSKTTGTFFLDKCHLGTCYLTILVKIGAVISGQILSGQMPLWKWSPTKDENWVNNIWDITAIEFVWCLLVMVYAE